MCYYIYGAVYGDVEKEEYLKPEGKYCYKLRCGTKHDVKLSVQENSDAYRVTDWYCDCDSDLGRNDPAAAQVKALGALFRDIQNTKGAARIYLCRTWNGKRNKREIRMKLDQIDIETALAELQENCLYTFEI